MRLLWLLVLASLLAACEENYPPSHRYPNQTGGSPSVYVAADGTCPATCSTPPGAILLDPSDAELRAGLLGVWRFCAGASSSFPDAPSDTIGVEFASLPGDTGYSAGNLFFLTSGPSGPVRGAGFEYQQIYNVTDGVLYIHPSYNSGRSLGAKYSPCPREWQFALWGDFDNKGTVVPF